MVIVIVWMVDGVDGEVAGENKTGRRGRKEEEKKKKKEEEELVISKVFRVNHDPSRYAMGQIGGDHALLVKWAWRFKNEHESMWRKVIISLHGEVAINGLLFLRVEDLFSCKLEDGSRIDFWKDVWFGSTPLYRRWPLIFSADRNKNVTVAARLKTEGDQTSIKDLWQLGMTSVEGISEVQDVAYMLSDVRITQVVDCCLWDQNAHNGFSVAAVKTTMRQNAYGHPGQGMRWENWVPIKVNALVWRLEKERIPARVELVKRKLNFPSVNSPMCNVGEETANHIFVVCGFAFGVWSKVWSWCRIVPASSNTIEDLAIFLLGGK
ncbi:uncharacterized protein LOC143592304 [Bidens hawaiensis]|uniref:uncharacterized protein LOC143592304 n=1 Tax=Bidens hawaiensis TaxID=980011 RepID=UPI00404A8B58